MCHRVLSAEHRNPMCIKHDHMGQVATLALEPAWAKRPACSNFGRLQCFLNVPWMCNAAHLNLDGLADFLQMHLAALCVHHDGHGVPAVDFISVHLLRSAASQVDEDPLPCIPND